MSTTGTTPVDPQHRILYLSGRMHEPQHRALIVGERLGLISYEDLPQPIPERGDPDLSA